MAGQWQAGLTQAEQQARVSLGELHGIRLHRIGRMDGVVMFQAGKSQRVPARAALSLVTAIEPLVVCVAGPCSINCEVCRKDSAYSAYGSRSATR